MSRLRYQIHNKIRFSGDESDVGTPGTSRVVVNAQLYECGLCGFKNRADCYIFLENDRIVGFHPADGTYDFGDNEDDFLVLEE